MINQRILGSWFVLLVLAFLIDGQFPPLKWPFKWWPGTAPSSPTASGSRGYYAKYIGYSLKEKQKVLVTEFGPSSETVYWKLKRTQPMLSQCLIYSMTADSKKVQISFQEDRPTRNFDATYREFISLFSEELLESTEQLFTSEAVPKYSRIYGTQFQYIERFPHNASNVARFIESPNPYNNDMILLNMKRVGMVIGITILNKQFLDLTFTAAFYKFILGLPIELQDTGATEHAFSSELDVRQRTRKYVEEIIAPPMNAICSGLFRIIPQAAFEMFNAHELETLISGESRINFADWQLYSSNLFLANSLFLNTFHRQLITGFWKCVKTWDSTMHRKLLLYVTGTSRIPVGGFKQGHGFAPAWFNLKVCTGDKYLFSKSLHSDPYLNVLYLPLATSFEDLKSSLEYELGNVDAVTIWHKSAFRFRYHKNSYGYGVLPRDGASSSMNRYSEPATNSSRVISNAFATNSVPLLNGARLDHAISEWEFDGEDDIPSYPEQIVNAR